MIKILKKIWALFQKKDLDMDSEDIKLDSEIDMSQIHDLAQQKKVCSEMFSILQDEESKVRNRFMVAQTVTDFLASDEVIRANVGEFVGYHFGSINHNMSMIESAMNSLKQFHDGHLDSIDSPARGMYVSIWYNIALGNLELATESMIHLESLETDLVEKEMADQESNQIVLRRGTLH